MSTPVAVQLWTLRQECQRDFFGTLEAIARAGYRWIEPYDFYGTDVDALAARLKELGLGVISSHVSLDRLEGDLELVMRDHAVLGCTQIICPWLDEERRKGPEAFEKVGRSLNEIGAKLLARGFNLAYHNHDFEFTKIAYPDGVMRILSRSLPVNLSAQLDAYWISFAGLDPVAYMQRLGSRLHSLHLKDGDPRRETFSPVGKGKLDMPAIIAAGLELGVKAFVVEQDECAPSPIEAIGESLKYLRSQGLGE